MDLLEGFISIHQKEEEKFCIKMEMPIINTNLWVESA
jgi:hypothetical protein